jgi:predicted dienelactone hydrolase
MTTMVLALALVLLPAPSLALPDLTQPGPFPVGFTVVTYTKPSETTGDPRVLDTWIWYPAVPGTGTANGDLFVDAAVAKRRWPLIMFSHGSCGFPGQSIFYTATLASRGFIVAAPPHPGNTTAEFSDCGSNLGDSFLNRVEDIEYVIDQLRAASATRSSPFWRRIHRRRIGMTGHSFGGQTTLRVLAADPRVRAGVALAPAPISAAGIRQPTMIIGAEIDSITPFEADSRGPFDQLEGPRFLVEILNGGHCAFVVACLEAFCGAGCGPDAVPLEEAHALTLRYAVPFFLRYVAGKHRFGKGLRPALAPSGVIVEGEKH